MKEGIYMLTMYPAIFFEEKEGGYSVIFPDLNHLSTCGDTLEEAMEMAVDCLAGFLYSEELDGNKVAPPTAIDKIDIHCEDDEDYNANDYVKAFVNIVSVNVTEYAEKHFNKPVKKTLSIPQWLNDTAINHKVNFSQVLKNALIDELKLKKIS